MSQLRRGPKRKHHTVTFEPDVWERWTQIGLFEGFQSDSCVAKFLLSLYSMAGGQNGKVSDRRCVGCHTILPLLCAKCQLPSSVTQSSKAMPSTQSKHSVEVTPSMPEMPPVHAALSSQDTPGVETIPTVPSVEATAASHIIVQSSHIVTSSTQLLMPPTDTPPASQVIVTSSQSTVPSSFGKMPCKDLSNSVNSFSESAVSIPSQADQSVNPPSNLDLPDCRLNSSNTCGEEPDEDFQQTWKAVSDFDEPQDLTKKRQTHETEFTLTKDKSKIPILGITGSHPDQSVEAVNENKREKTRSHAKGIISKQSTKDEIIRIAESVSVEKVVKNAPRKMQTRGLKRKLEMLNMTDNKKGGGKPAKVQLKGITEKIDPARQNRKNTESQTEEKLITYEPKAVLGHGKKIGKFYYYSEYMCACCDKVFPGKTEFNKHITEMKRQEERKSHRKYERKKKQCPECQEMVELGREFTQHIKRHTAPKMTCPECQQQFIFKREFARHIKAHRGERPFLCTICGDGFKHAGQLSNHMITHRTVRSFMCSVCGKAFKSAGILRGHEAIHSGEKKFQCQQCGRSFARRHTLNVHMLVHTSVKPFKCDQCDASFINRTKLRYHRTFHTNPMAYKCEECGTTFRSPTSLRNHRNIHLGMKPCVCPLCHKTFARPSYLRNHLKSHSDEKPYKCKHCIRAFTKRGSLNHHLKTVHPDMYVSRTSAVTQVVVPEDVSVSHQLVVMAPNAVSDQQQIDV